MFLCMWIIPFAFILLHHSYKRKSGISKQIDELQNKIHNIEKNIDDFRNQIIFPNSSAFRDRKRNYREISNKMNNKLLVLYLFQCKLQELEKEI